ncbi:MAG: pentapeptide repeat-containing protein [Cyanobacteria bacterium P01_H01_bin.21]
MAIDASKDSDKDSDRFDLREILLCGSEAWNQWRKENPRVSRDLIEVNLSDINFSDINFNGVDLGMANLRDANLRGFNLTGINLAGADLFGADFRDANLRIADLRGALLHGAKFDNANLCGADLFGAFLREANLTNANFDNANLRSTLLCGANLCGANFRGVSFSNANLRNTNLLSTNLRNADLHGANLPFLIKLRLYSRQIIQKNILSFTKETFILKIFDKKIDQNDLIELKIATSNYIDAADYTEPKILVEENGPYFSKTRYRVTKILTPGRIEEVTREGEELYRREKENLKAQPERTRIESTQKLANATADILIAVEPFKDIALTFGKLIVVKHTASDGQARTIVGTVSTETQGKLESMPRILNAPNTLLAFFEGEATEGVGRILYYKYLSYLS